MIAFLGGFHGRTMGAVSLTASKAKYHAHFGPMLPGVYHVPFGNEGLDEIEQRVFKRLMPADEFAAIVVEPIQGEGGYVVPEDDFLPRLRELCDRHGILLIADEVQSGAGRTGKMWAVQHWDVEPDILLTAKGIGSGMPVGAMIAKADLMTWGPGAHGSTFGGNPVSLAAVLETIHLLENGLIANAAIRGREIQDALRPLLERHPALVKDVRGKGLMIGIQFDSGDDGRGGPDAGVRHAGCSCSRPARTASGCPRRWSCPRPRPPPRSACSPRPSTTLPPTARPTSKSSSMSSGRGWSPRASAPPADRGTADPTRLIRHTAAMPGKVASMHDAIADIVRDGDTVAIEGFTHLIGFSAGHEIIRQRRRDLTLARMTPDVIYDQMIAAGVARKLIFSWLGNPGVGGLNAIRRRIEPASVGEGTALEIEEYSHFGMVARYTAGAANLPFMPLRSYFETDLPVGQPADPADQVARTPTRSCTPSRR